MFKKQCKLSLSKKIISMYNRLVAENTIKVPFKGQPYFSINHKLLAFASDSIIRVRAINRQCKDIEIAIPPHTNVIHFKLSCYKPWLYLLTSKNILQIYFVEYLLGSADGIAKKIAILHHITSFEEIKNAILAECTNETLKYLSLQTILKQTHQNLNIDLTKLHSLANLEKQKTVENHLHWIQYRGERDGEKVFIKKIYKQGEVAEEIVDVYEKKKEKYQKTITLKYIHQILVTYKDRYIFQQKLPEGNQQQSSQKQIQIFDIEDSKFIGKFRIEGSIKHAEIQQNLLLIISNVENTDYYNFFVLNPHPCSSKSLISYRNVYEKGKGDYYNLINLRSIEASILLEKKKNQELLAEITYQPEISNQTVSLIYILSKSKEKAEIIRLEHSKLFKSPFLEQKLDIIVYSQSQADRTIQSIKKQEELEAEKTRIKSSMQYKHSDNKSLEEAQKKFVQLIIDTKLKIVMRKFLDLEKRVQNLEKHMKSVYEKIEISLQKVNREEIKKKIENLFEDLTPQFQKYFTEIFKQVSGVLDQGVNFYNLKLAKEAEMHKDALSQIVTETFKAHEEIIQISKKEMSVTEKTEEHLRKLMEVKKKWTKSAEDYDNRTRELPTVKGGGVQGQVEGKVFVRADLNHPNSLQKRQT